MPSAAAYRRRLARLASALFERTGDPRFASAAAMLVGRRPGRPSKNDADAVALARSMLRGGLVASARAAAMQAAMMFADGPGVERMAARIRRKLAQN